MHKDSHGVLYLQPTNIHYLRLFSLSIVNYKNMLDIDEIPSQHTESTVPCFIAGLVGGLSGLAVGHPFVKVRLQTQKASSKYKGTVDCFISTIRQEKVFGLYKGMASPAAGVAVVNALVFGSFDWLIKLQEKYRINNAKVTDCGDQGDKAFSRQPSLSQIMAAGMGAGVITSFVTCPMELAKVQLQNQTHSTPMKGPIDCLTHLYKRRGIRGCFTGMTPTIVRELSFGPYFVTYECISRISGNRAVTGPKVIVAGGIAGIIAWCSTYPADVIKTRIQASPGEYKSMIDCARRCYQAEGIGIMFRGLFPTLLRAFPSNAATFVAYTWTMKMLTEDTRNLGQQNAAAVI
ncbi:mitochondrial carrier domain-containing protein [Zychaea mexicana]|uniref:mitochondrial carrier domain-containing protein n=1 Tax=Zychaea mexicana TaxID=64656 RepID=UPI0022FE7849|nr:mitochondrial carrier domain-containing protein [Zychaea mexicana]KAI9497839.1 mitochondrial carrier domain-containing protein [Zychaea mexicana]